MRFCVSPKPFFEIRGRSVNVVDLLFRELADLGIGGVNLDLPAPGEQLEWRDYARNVSDAAREVGLGISMHAPTTDISSVDAETRASAVATHVGALEEIGETITGAVYVIHPETFMPVRQVGDDQARVEMCHQSLAELQPVARARGIRLALENMRHRAENPNRTGMFTDQLTEIIRGLDEETIGICFDVGHAFISEGDGLYDAFQRNAARIIHIHLADNHGIDDEHLEPGEGDIDLARFHGIAQACGFGGMVQLEVKVKEGDDPLEFYRRNYERFARGFAPASPPGTPSVP